MMIYLKNALQTLGSECEGLELTEPSLQNKALGCLKNLAIILSCVRCTIFAKYPTTGLVRAVLK